MNIAKCARTRARAWHDVVVVVVVNTSTSHSNQYFAICVYFYFASAVAATAADSICSLLFFAVVVHLFFSSSFQCFVILSNIHIYAITCFREPFSFCVFFIFALFILSCRSGKCVCVHETASYELCMAVCVCVGGQNERVFLLLCIKSEWASEQKWIVHTYIHVPIYVWLMSHARAFPLNWQCHTVCRIVFLGISEK